MRKNRNYKEPIRNPEDAQSAYLAKLREDEDSSLDRSKSKTAYPNWIHCSQELRNKIIADFEAAVYEKFGAFPKPNWMN